MFTRVGDDKFGALALSWLALLMVFDENFCAGYQYPRDIKTVRTSQDVRNETSQDPVSAQPGVSPPQRDDLRKKHRRCLPLLWRKESGICQKSSLFLVSFVPSNSSIMRE